MHRKSFIQIYLQNDFCYTEAVAEIDFILDSLFNYTYKDFVLGKNLSDKQLLQVEQIINKRIQTKKPIQQIIGYSFFYGRKFFVNENTLIPRPETELLVKETLNLINNNIHYILDIGSGSGCIPITLALESPNLKIDSVDISDEAIKVANRNKIFHQVEERVQFFHSDLFENIKNKYDIIVSNPPYIPLKDKEELQYEVKQYDPETALFAKDDNGIEFYEKISSKAYQYINPNGFLLYEIGINQSELIKNILIKNKFRIIKILKDFNNIERVIISQK